MSEAIHSGHFMVSDIDDPGPDDGDTVAVPVLDAEDRAQVAPEQRGFNFENACKETSDTYTFGPRSTKSISIDATLTKLFQCMTIAYSGKLTSPRWKNFKGLKLRWKDKIRLNNVIWRAWHMQFVKRKSPVVCQFASPLDGDTHNKPEAVVLEGKYWKRRLETVCAEYKKWRLYYKQQTDRSRAFSDAGFDLDLFNWQPRSNQSYHSSCSMLVDDDPFAEFNDTLFSCLIPNQPFAFPNPREIARAGLAEFIQPGLVQLQPNLDDFMDTFDIFGSRFQVDTSEDNSLQDLLTGSVQVPATTSTQENFNTTILLNQTRESISYSENKTSSENTPVNSYSVDDNEFMDTTSLPVLDPESTKVKNSVSSSIGAISTTGTIQSLQLIPESRSSIDEQICSSLGSSRNSSVESLPQSQKRYSPPDGLFLGQQARSITTVHHSKTLKPNKFVGNVSTSQSFPPVPTANTDSIPVSTSAASFAKQTLVQRVQPSSASAVYIRSRIPRALEPKVPAPRASHSCNSTNNVDLANSSSKQDVFIMPKSTPRMRARSMSGPQITTCQENILLYTPKTSSIVPASSLNTSITSVNPVLPQNALLAQLLTSGTYVQPSTAELSTSSLAIISSAAATPQTTQTVVISPVSLASINNLNNQVASPEDQFISQNSVPSLSVTPAENNLLTKGTSALTLPSLPSKRSLLESQASPAKPSRPKSDTDRVQYREHRRVCHINAEQKRRCNIKTGFDTLHMLIPSLSQNPNAKVSKAAMLQKAGEYIVQLRAERAQFQEEAEQLRKQIESLNQAISMCQSQLPATGAPVSRQRASKLKDMFDEYVRKRTMQNWKFWIFSILIQPLLNTYNSCVSTSSLEEMCRTILSWLDQHCSLVVLRPAVLNSLRHLSTTTSILTDPNNIAEEASMAIRKTMQRGQ